MSQNQYANMDQNDWYVPVHRAELAALRKDAERYRWHRARNPSSLLLTAWGASKAACGIGSDCDAATDAAMREAAK